jgi:hypothetical protein
MGQSNQDYMDYLVRKSLKAIAESRSDIPQRQINLGDFRSIQELKQMSEGVPSNGYLILAGFLVSRVGYDSASEKYVVVTDVGNEGISVIVSFEKMQKTVTLVRDLVGCDMPGCSDFAYADIVAIAVKNDMKVLQNNCVGFTGVDLYAYQKPGYRGKYTFFLARDKSNKLMVVDDDIFEEEAKKNNIDSQSLRINQSVQEFLQGTSGTAEADRPVKQVQKNIWEVEKLNDLGMLDVAKAVSELQEYCVLEAKLVDIDQKRQSIRAQAERMKTENNGLQNALCFLGIPFAIIASICNKDMALLGGIVLYGILYYVVYFLIVDKIIMLATRGSKEQKAEEWYAAEDSKIKQEKRDVHERLEEMKSDEQKMKNAKKYFPQQYWNVDAIEFICDALKTGKASTVDEAINLYDRV